MHFLYITIYFHIVLHNAITKKLVNFHVKRPDAEIRHFYSIINTRYRVNNGIAMGGWHATNLAAQFQVLCGYDNYKTKSL